MVGWSELRPYLASGLAGRLRGLEDAPSWQALRYARVVLIPGLQLGSEVMRADVEAAAADIEQSVGLLRRRL